MKTDESPAEAGQAGAPDVAAASPRSIRGLEPQVMARPVVVVVLLAFVLLVLPSLLSTYYIDASTQVAIYAIVALGLGVLVGRVGMVSLGQAAVLAIGAWVAARILFATSLPYPLVLLASGLITMVLGTLVGLPALRLSGLYLALITLMLAGAITVVLATTNFPNGGHGFLGYNGSSVHIPPIRRPSIAQGETAYFRYSVIVAVLMFLLVVAHVRSKPGRAWAAIRQSEAAALAGGINTTFYKLWAFALASFVTGVAGGLLAGALHYLYSIDFQTQDSITLLAVVLDGRRVQPVGRGPGRDPAPVPAGSVHELGDFAGLAHDPVRGRRAPGADHRAARDHRSVPQGHGPVGPADRPALQGPPFGLGKR